MQSPGQVSERCLHTPDVSCPVSSVLSALISPLHTQNSKSTAKGSGLGAWLDTEPCFDFAILPVRVSSSSMPEQIEKRKARRLSVQDLRVEV